MTSTTTVQTSPANAANQASSAAGSSAGSGNALSSLSGNFNDFLNLLMTQLQNQDPTSPLDTNQFTSQLVQFASVEQQINTNSSLTQLISLTQSDGLLQSTAMLGSTVTAQSNQLPLQNGAAALQFTAPTAEPVTITLSTTGGTVIASKTVDAAAGANSWTWNGKDAAGNQYPDGSYGVTVTSGSGTQATAVPFTITGTATGVVSQNSTLQLQLGATAVDVSAVQSVKK